MNLNEYQEFTASTAVYNREVTVGHYLHGTGLPEMYPVLALAEEAGEVAGKYAKFVRKHQDAHSPEEYGALVDAVILELGDVLYNVSEIARQLGVPLQVILDHNVQKLTDRKARNVIVGEGDNR